ncbi:MAG: DUF5615 family PIN-like protein [Acidobacteriota bacterium]
MRFMVDECTGPGIARWLRTKGYDTDSVFDEARGISDEKILEIAVREGRIVITNDDKDFGETIFRRRLAQCGVVILRLEDERLAAKTAALEKLLLHHQRLLANRFVVATQEKIRIAG